MGDLEDDTDESIDDSAYQSALGTRPDLPDYLDDFLQDDAYEKILGKTHIQSHLFMYLTGRDKILIGFHQFYWL